MEVEGALGRAGTPESACPKLTHRRDTLEEIFLRQMGHIQHTPGESAREG